MSKRQEKTPPKTAMESEKQHPRKGGVGNKRKIKWEQYQEKDHRRMWSIEANNTGRNLRSGQWLWLKLFLTIARFAQKNVLQWEEGEVGGIFYKFLGQVSRHDTPRATPSGGHANGM